MLRRSITITVLILVYSEVSAGPPTDVVGEIEGISWMVEHYPPFNYKDEADGKLKGITVDVLMRMFVKVGVNLGREDLKLLPWPRAYQYLLGRPGTALFSMTYTAERLEQFRFVGPIIPTRVSVICPKSKAIEISEPTDLNGLRIGTVRDDIGEQLVLALGVPEKALARNKSALNLVRMLAVGRLDAIAYAEDIARFQMMEAGMDPEDFESVHVLQKSHMGYAFHKETDPRILEPLQKVLDELREDGTVDRIYSTYKDREASETPEPTKP